MTEQVPDGLVRDPRSSNVVFLGRGSDVIAAWQSEDADWEFRQAVGVAPWKQVIGIGSPGLDCIVQARRKFYDVVRVMWHVAVENRRIAVKKDDRKLVTVTMADFSTSPAVLRDVSGQFICEIADDGQVEVLRRGDPR